MNKDQKLLAEAYTQILENNGGAELIKRIEAKAGASTRDTPHFYAFGKTGDGRLYGVVQEADTYSDGDRWIDEVDYFYQVEGEEGKYISDEEGKQLKKRAGDFPELNKHMDIDELEYYTNKISREEYEKRRYS
jgi:hypothetical protein